MVNTKLGSRRSKASENGAECASKSSYTMYCDESVYIGPSVPDTKEVCFLNADR